MIFVEKYNNFISKEKRRKIKIIYFLGILTAILEVIGISLIIPILSLISNPTFFYNPILSKFVPDFFINSDWNVQIIILLIFVTFFYFLKNAYIILYTYITNIFFFSIQKEISNNLLSIYLKLPFLELKKISSPKILRNLTSEAAFLQRLISSSVTLFIEIVLLTLIFTGLLIYNTKLTLIVFLIFFSSAFIFYFFARKKNMELGKIRQKSEESKSKTILEIIGALREVIIYKKKDFFFDKYKMFNENISRAAGLQTVLQQSPRILLETVFLIAVVILVYITVLNKDSLDELLLLMALFAAASFKILPSINRILLALQTMRYSSPVIKNLREQFNLKNKIVNHTNLENKLRKNSKNMIELKNVSFDYSNGKTILKNIDLKIKFGETIAIIGPSGTGKSTLFDLILGLVQPSSGKVLIYGDKIDQVKEFWHSQVGFVPQKPYILNDLIKFNIAFGTKIGEVDNKKLLNSINLSQLKKLIFNIKKGPNFVVQENGNNLSGGQAQRLGIARALYNNPKLLIFDEPTSSLDVKLEKSFHNVLSSFKRKKTIIISTHKLHTLKFYDKVYTISNKKLKLLRNV